MSTNLKKTLLFVVFLLGYTSLSFELIILRELINFVGSNTLVTSIIIAEILLFMSVGYYIGSVINMATNSIRKYVATAIKILAFWYILACTHSLQELYFFLLRWVGINNIIYLVFIFSTLFLALPSTMMGFITSVIGRFIHHQNSNYTGRFMAIDTTGSVSGSLVTTLVVMPLLGVGSATIILVFLTLLALLLIAPKKDKVENIILSCMILGITFFTSNEKLLLPETSLIKDDAISRIEIYAVDDEENSQASTKLMMINGSLSSLISDDETKMFPYIKFINKKFVETLPKGKVHNILVLGAGGFTIGLNDDVNNYTFLDIDKDLKDISEKYFLSKPLGNNKKFIIQDAYWYMMNNNEKYDLIIVDVYSSVTSIPMNFVTIDFFSKVKNSLKDNGIMVANIITSPSFSTTYSRRLDNTLRYVFPQYLERQVVTEYTNNPEEVSNVEYIYYNYPPDNTVYSINKNTAIYN